MRRSLSPAALRLIALGLLIVGGSPGARIVAQPATEGSQAFTIIPAYEGLAAFVAAARANPETDRQMLHRRHAVQPFEGPCRARLPSFTIALHDNDLDALTARVERLRAVAIEAVVEHALHRAGALLPGPGMTVCINLAQPTKTIEKMRGVGGGALGGNRILLLLHPVDEHAWLELTPYVVAHEYHHEVARSRYGASTRTGLSTLLLEGRADSFARLLYPDTRPPWIDALSPEEEAAFWTDVQPYLHRSYSDMTFYRDFMFGLKEGLPGWAGYKVGFQIVQAYLSTHPDSPVPAWTALDPAQFLAGSGYGR